MFCTTTELVKYVRDEYIVKHKTKEGIEFLLRILEKNTRYKSDLITLLAQSHQLKRADILNILENRVPLNNNIHSFIQLIDFIEHEEGKYIFVKKDKEIQYFKTLIEGRNPRKLPTAGEIKSSKRKIFFKKLTPKKKQFLMALVILTPIVFYLVPGNQSLFTNSNYSESDIKLIPANEFDRNGYWSPLNQITTWNNQGADTWGLWLANYTDYEEAKRIQQAYKRLRDIDIVYLDDEKFHLLIIKESKTQIKKQHSSEVKKTWRNSVIIPIDKCYLIQERNQEFYYCQSN